MLISLPDERATEYLGEILGRTLTAGSVILLSGELGAGKTTLVRGLGRGLGIDEAIVSPTFSLINEYDRGRLPLYHLDLYRLTSAEVANIYPEIYWEGKEVTPGITAIEWAERLVDKPTDFLDISLFENLEESKEIGRIAKIFLIGNIDFNLNSLSLEFKIIDPG